MPAASTLVRSTDGGTRPTRRLGILVAVALGLVIVSVGVAARRGTNSTGRAATAIVDSPIVLDTLAIDSVFNQLAREDSVVLAREGLLGDREKPRRARRR